MHVQIDDTLLEPMKHNIAIKPSDSLILVIRPCSEAQSASLLVIQTHHFRRFYLAADFLGLRRSGVESVKRCRYLVAHCQSLPIPF